MPENLYQEERQEKTGRSFLGSPPLRVVVSVLVVELERKLNLARIVRRVARRADKPEVRVLEIRGTRYRDHTVTAKSRRVEVRMIQNVEDFRSELQTESFLDREILEDGEIQPVETGSRHLSDSPQGIISSQVQTSCWRRRIRSQYARLSESSRITEPAKML